MCNLLEQAPREASLLYWEKNCPGYVTGHLIEEARRSHSLLSVLFSWVQNCLCYEQRQLVLLPSVSVRHHAFSLAFTLCSSKEAFVCDYIVSLLWWHGTSLLPRNGCPALGNDSMGIALWIMNLFLWYLRVLSWNMLTKCWVRGLWSGVIAPPDFLLQASFHFFLGSDRDYQRWDMGNPQRKGFYPAGSLCPGKAQQGPEFPNKSFAWLSSDGED